MKKLFPLIALALFAYGCGGIGGGGGTPTPVPTCPCPCPTPTGTSAPTDTPTAEPTATTTAEPTVTAEPTLTPTARPTSRPTARVTPTPSSPGPRPSPSPRVIVEKFRGDLKADKPFTKGPDGRTCRAGGSTLWFWMTQGRQSCAPNSRGVQPADYGHMGVPNGTPPGQPAIDAANCKPTALNFSGRWWDDPRGPEIRVTRGSRPVVIQTPNPYEWTLCADPGPVVFKICPRAALHSCADPRCTSGGCPCDPVPFTVEGSDGCTTRGPVTFPKL